MTETLTQLPSNSLIVTLSAAFDNSLLVVASENCGAAYEADLATAAQMANGKVVNVSDNKSVVTIDNTYLLKAAALLTVQLRMFGYKVELR